MGYLWRGIELEVFSSGKFRRGAKNSATLYAIINNERRHIAVLTAEDMDWPIEILAGVYMPEWLKKRVQEQERAAVNGWTGTERALPWWVKHLPYPPELMVIEDEDAFQAAAEAYDLSRS